MLWSESWWAHLISDYPVSIGTDRANGNTTFNLAFSQLILSSTSNSQFMLPYLVRMMFGQVTFFPQNLLTPMHAETCWSVTAASCASTPGNRGTWGKRQGIKITDEKCGFCIITGVGSSHLYWYDPYHNKKWDAPLWQFHGNDKFTWYQMPAIRLKTYALSNDLPTLNSRNEARGCWKSRKAFATTCSFSWSLNLKVSKTRISVQENHTDYLWNGWNTGLW